MVRAASSDDKCAASGQTFYCPNCGGVEVTDCLACDGYLNTDPSHGMCFDRRLFNNHDTSGNPDEHYRFLWNDIVGTIVWFIAAGVATACGVGGGGIYVPLGILLLQFAPKPASGLSQASIFGASLGGLIINIRAKHPNTRIRDLPCQRDEDGNIVLPPEDDDEEEDAEPDAEYVNRRAFSLQRSLVSGTKYYTRPVIDYDMALFLAPMEMAGAVLGKLIQAILPNWLYLLLASVILGFTSYKTYKKFFASRTKEKEEAAKKKEKEAEKEAKRARESVTLDSSHIGELRMDGAKGNDSSEDSTADDVVGVEAAPGDAAETDGADAEEESEKNGSDGSDDDLKEVAVDNEEDVKALEEEDRLRVQYLEEDARQYPREKLLALLILWIGLMLITFLKGGKGVESLVGITCESPWYAVLVAFQFIWTLGFAALYAYKLLKMQKRKEAVRYPFQPHDVIWDGKKIRFYSSFTFLAGIVAGLIGIGGGMVLGPLMLVMGIHPRVSTATTATMIVLTSSSVAIMFVTSGLVPWSYAVWFFFVCLTGAYLGKKYIDGYVKKTGKASILIGILATIIALATIGCLVIVFTRLAANNWCFAGFSQWCYVSSDDGTCAGARLLELFV